jgi:hypothetical protein
MKKTKYLTKYINSRRVTAAGDELRFLVCGFWQSSGDHNTNVYSVSLQQCREWTLPSTDKSFWGHISKESSIF